MPELLARHRVIVCCDSEDILPEASNLQNPEMQGARRLVLSPIENGDYTLPVSSFQTGAIPKTTDRRRTLHEEFNAVADKSMYKNRDEVVKRDPMAGRYEELKIAFNNMRVENRQL